MYSEKEELVNIVKQAAKERLQLEQQLAHSRDKEVRVASLVSKACTLYEDIVFVPFPFCPSPSLCKALAQLD